MSGLGRLGLGLRNFGRRGSSGGGSPAVTALNFPLGQNVIDANWYYGDTPFTDLWKCAEDYTYLTASGLTTLPDANRDSNGWAKSVPGDSTSGVVYALIHWPLEPCTADMTWTSGTFDFLALNVAGGATLTQTGPQSAQIVFTDDVSTASNTHNLQLQMTPNAANWPKGIQIIPRGRSGTFTPESKARLQAFARKYIRLIKWQPAVERTSTPLVVTTRNLPTDAMWLRNDGIPMEIMLQLCAETGLDGWFNFGLGESDSVLNQKLALIDAFLAANPTRNVAAQSSNESWNSLYVANQELLRDLASTDGLDGPVAGVAISSITFSGTTATVTTATAHGRSTNDFITLSGATPAAYNVKHVQITVTGASTFTYSMASTPATNATVAGSYNLLTDVFGGQMKEDAKRSNHVMSLLEAAVAPSRMSRVRRIIGTWNVNTSVSTTLLSYADTPTHHDDLATASYWGDSLGTYPASGTYTTADFDAILADVKASTDQLFDQALAQKTVAASYGLGLVDYEFGIARPFNDLATATSWYNSTQVYKATMYALQEWRRRLGQAPANWFVETGPIFVENNAGRSLQEYLGQATTQKGQAVLDFLGDTARLPNVLETTGLGSRNGDPNGTVVGALTKFVVGSTITIISGGADLALSDTLSGPTVSVTIANSTLSPSAAESVTFRESNPLFPAPGYKDTVLSRLVASATLTPTNGPDKSDLLTLSDANLSATGSGAFTDCLVRATAGAGPDKFHLEITNVTGGASIKAWAGLDNGTTDLSVEGVVPGRNNASGIAILMQDSGWVVYQGGGGLDGDGTHSGYWPAGSMLIIEGEKTAGTVVLKRRVGGVDNTLWTFSGVTGWEAFVGTQISDKETVNFGGSAFASTPSAGYSAYA